MRKVRERVLISSLAALLEVAEGGLFADALPGPFNSELRAKHTL